MDNFFLQRSSSRLANVTMVSLKEAEHVDLVHPRRRDLRRGHFISIVGLHQVIQSDGLECVVGVICDCSIMLRWVQA